MYVQQRPNLKFSAARRKGSDKTDQTVITF